MKKFFLSILTLLYMAMSSGIAMDIHYCMGERAGVEFYASQNKKCGKCGMTEKNNGCCHDEHSFHKLADSHKNVSNDINFEATGLAIVILYPSYILLSSLIDRNIGDYNNAPPDYTKPPACIMNGVFRI